MMILQIRRIIVVVYVLVTTKEIYIMNKELIHHEKMFNLVDQFKVAGLATIHNLLNQGNEQYLTTIASHITMYDVHIAMYGHMDWSRVRRITVKHVSGIMTGFSYSVTDTLRCVASKAFYLQSDLRIANDSNATYFNRSINANDVLDIVCSLMDKYHVVEYRTGELVDIKV